MPDVLERTEVDESIAHLDFDLEDDDPESVSHIIKSPLWAGGISAQEIIAVATARGLELEALCGHRFIPTKSVEGLPVCKACLNALPNGAA